MARRRRGVDLGDTVCFQLLNLIRQNHTPTAGKYLDMASTLLLEEVIHVFEIFRVATLVAGHSNGLGIFLYGGIDHLFNAPVVAQVDHFTTCSLYDPAHDIDGRIMAIEEAGSGNDTHLVLGLVGHRSLVAAKVLLSVFSGIAVVCSLMGQKYAIAVE